MRDTFEGFLIGLREARVADAGAQAEVAQLDVSRRVDENVSPIKQEVRFFGFEV